VAGKAIAERVKELAKNEDNTTELDNEILGLAAIIDGLEQIHHDTPYALERADLIGKLKRAKAEIISKKVDIEYKARVVMDADSLWAKLANLIDEEVEDEQKRYTLKDKVMKVLDLMVENGAARMSE